jgi:MFS family permease
MTAQVRARATRRAWFGSPLWRNRDFVLLWGGETVASFGAMVGAVVVPLLAVQTLHAGAGQMGLLGAAGKLPFLLYVVAGVWVDRVSRRPVLIGANLARALLLLLIPIEAVAGVLSLGLLAATLFAAATCTVWFDTAYMSYLPSLVARDQLVEGNSLLESTRAAAQVAGPSLGGILVQVLTAPVAVLVDAVSLLASAAMIWRIRRPEGTAEGTAAAAAGETAAQSGKAHPGAGPGRSGSPNSSRHAAAIPGARLNAGAGGSPSAGPAASRNSAGQDASPDGAGPGAGRGSAGRRGLRGVRADLMEGFRFVAGSRTLRPLALAIGLSNAAGAAEVALYVIFLVTDLGLPAALVGVTLAGAGPGTLVGALFAGRTARRIGISGAIIGGLALFAAATLLIPLTPHGTPAAVPLLVVAGFLMAVGGQTCAVNVMSLRQAITPDRLQGRVNASFRFLGLGLSPLGALAGGLVGAALGARPALFLAAAAMVAAPVIVACSPVRRIRALPGSAAEPVAGESP